jgi:hypothetical protein
MNQTVREAKDAGRTDTKNSAVQKPSHAHGLSFSEYLAFNCYIDHFGGVPGELLWERAAASVQLFGGEKLGLFGGKELLFTFLAELFPELFYPGKLVGKEMGQLSNVHNF